MNRSCVFLCYNTLMATPISIKEVFVHAIALLKKYFLEVVSVTVLPSILSQLLERSSFYEHNQGVYWLLWLVVIAISIVVGFGLLVYINTREHGKKILYIDAIKNASPRILPGLIVNILSFILIFVGFILFIIPGIIALIFLSQNTYFVLFENKSPLQSFSLSKQLTKGNRWRILGIFGGFMIPYIAILMGVSVRFGQDVSVLLGIIPGAFSTVLYYSLWRALRKANPTVS